MMKKLSVMLLVLLALACKKEEKNCPEGFTGNGCTEELEPQQIVVEEMAILNWPSTDGSGVAWDVGSNVDLYAKIIRIEDGAVLFTSPVFENAQHGFTVSWIPNVTIDKDHLVYVEVWDDDGGFSSDELVAFTIAPYWMNGEGFPTVQTINDSGITIKYSVRYRF